MLKSITLHNFKRFERYSVSCREHNILVGPNNAGKSSILDALRVLHGVLRFTQRNKPNISTLLDGNVGAQYQIPDTFISITNRNISHNYNDNDAVIEFLHENGNLLRVFMHPDRLTRAEIHTTKIIRTTKHFQENWPCSIVIVPTLGPFEENEPLLQVETIRRNESTRLASRNFRNIWRVRPDSDFKQFSDLVSNAWSGISVLPPEIEKFPPYSVRMYYDENRYQREIYWSGFGLQVWMQMMTHFISGNDQTILVLDEPDIYLHPDLQKKLIEIAFNRFGQIFVATHSTEIINVANSGDVLLVSVDNRSAKRIVSDEAYRQVYAYLGSSENADFSRLSRAKRIIFFDGKDRRIINKIAKKIGLDGPLLDSDTLFLESGGFEQWRRVKETHWTLYQVFDINTRIASIFDRDHRPDEEIVEFESKMNDSNLFCKVLDRKEIENYCWCGDALPRAIFLRAKERNIEIKTTEIDKLITNIEKKFYHEIQSNWLAKHLSYFENRDKNTARNRLIEKISIKLKDKWSNVNGRLSVIPGKNFIATVSTELQKRYGFSITTHQILDSVREVDIPQDLRTTLTQASEFLAA